LAVGLKPAVMAKIIQEVTTDRWRASEEQKELRVDVESIRAPLQTK